MSDTRDRAHTRLELIKLVWFPVVPGDPIAEALARAKALEAYVLEPEEVPDVRPGPTPPRRR